ncbi:uncharacterized protein IUM83_01129 [Phytophthora cinnamomi]|uniref:uncharacterized protein n=1 Tax=Phytophthora cinnamomi TaxID=4785 RepID=UPI0035596BAE|nr:hypothetical protein IUM83_01129 [Phytophthora cinnamomi]
MGEEKESYNQEDVDLALARVAAGEKKAAVVRTSPVPLRTLFQLVKRAADGGSIVLSRPGPKPVMPAEPERDLAEWIAAMQRCGMPVGRRDIIAKASATLAVATGRVMPTRATPTRILTGGWYRRFLQRHPFLSNRIVQCIARVRNAVDEDGVATLFYTLAKLFVELKIDAARIFNMDKKSLMPKTARRKVVAVRGSANVWRKETKTSFHMTVVGAAAEICVEYGIMLVALPANATHLFQPLDVALFKPYKDCVHDLMLERLCAISNPVIRKTTAIGMACTAYRRALMDKPSSAVNGFRECDMWPLSMVQLKARLALYKGGGAKGEIGTADWLKQREAVIDEVRTEILFLPPVPVTGKKRKRSTADVAGRLVTKERLLAGSRNRATNWSGQNW